MSPTRRLVPLLIAGSAVIAAGCSDAVAPKRSTSVSDLPTVAAFGGAPSYAKKANDNSEAGAQTIVFKIFPQGGSARIGGFTLVYPAHAVCDPNRSGYGPTEWKKDCPTLKSPITIRGKVWVEDGITLADFSPDIRFAPDKNVYLATFIPQLVGQTLTDALKATYSIGFSTRQGNTRYFIDDAATDPDLATIFATNSSGQATGAAKRKIYHFTGYFVREGIWCEEGSEQNDPLCLEWPL